jgi:hypothetical protein
VRSLFFTEFGAQEGNFVALNGFKWKFRQIGSYDRRRPSCRKYDRMCDLHPRTDRVLGGCHAQ